MSNSANIINFFGKPKLPVSKSYLALPEIFYNSRVYLSQDTIPIDKLFLFMSKRELKDIWDSESPDAVDCVLSETGISGYFYTQYDDLEDRNGYDIECEKWNKKYIVKSVSVTRMNFPIPGNYMYFRFSAREFIPLENEK